MLRISKRDLFATLFVAGAVVLYLLWAVGAEPPGMGGIRVNGLVVLALGFAASASAVVPSFERLIHGNKAYLATTSLIGLAALLAGIATVVERSETWLGVLVATTAVLWAIATAHHIMLSRGASTAGLLRRAARGPRRHATV